MKKLLLILLTVIVVSTLVFGGCAKPAPTPAPAPAPAPAKEPIVIKFVSVLPDMYPDNVFNRMLIEKVNNKAKGELILEFAGGPEAMAPPDSPAAVQRGAIDMADNLNSLINMIVPGLACISHAEITVEEFRAGGAFDYASELVRKAGMFYLGISQPCEPQTKLNFFTKKKIEKIEDFAGLKIAMPSPTFLPIIKALGGTPVIIQFTDYFTAMERGTVDGFNLGLPGIIGFGLVDVTPYVVDHPYSSHSSAYIINLELWNKLPKHLQDIMVEAAIEVETEGAVRWTQVIEELTQQLEQKGMQFVKFSSPADAEKFDVIRRESEWQMLLGRHPDIAPKFKELLIK